MDNPVLSYKGEKIEVKKIFNCLFKNEDTKELIRVWYQDFDGLLIYETCSDSLRKKRKISSGELFWDYERVWEGECT
ncbi:hypothetical protein [Lysinibacillus fusiformis]|uniref:hypothetical protein n=1 Tax=Lysinibacillus fusiformis TaxID=28031 RepID=UPI00263B442C|nr:hypothetical protein [Lysinibacillus fusiformis]MDC6267741.1 hypothetical protein [Lysinibacillus sphaericus]MDN4967769.1 hypothetical protein [Lysinibacillus fusiformis]MDN4967825.1 hypothetical protein [Lysinibacillus fusiformis]